jgi:hypothetical protein
VLGLSKTSFLGFHSSHLPKSSMSADEFLELAIQIETADKALIADCKRKLNLFGPGRPRKYWRIQRARKQVLARLRAEGKITTREIRDARARARRLGEECPWEVLFEKSA